MTIFWVRQLFYVVALSLLKSIHSTSIRVPRLGAGFLFIRKGSKGLRLAQGPVPCGFHGKSPHLSYALGSIFLKNLVPATPPTFLLLQKGISILQSLDA